MRGLCKNKECKTNCIFERSREDIYSSVNSEARFRKAFKSSCSILNLPQDFDNTKFLGRPMDAGQRTYLAHLIVSGLRIEAENNNCTIALNGALESRIRKKNSKNTS